MLTYVMSFRNYGSLTTMKVLNKLKNTANDIFAADNFGIHAKEN